MVCQNCNDKEALYERYIETGVGGMVKIFVCQDCARKLDFLQKDKKTNEKTQTANTQQKSCPVCGTRQDVFLRSLYAGCSACYEVFGEETDKFLSRYHGKSVHVGKVPESRLKQVPRDIEFQQLSQKMTRAINEGDVKTAENARREFFKRGGDF